MLQATWYKNELVIFTKLSWTLCQVDSHKYTPDRFGSNIIASGFEGRASASGGTYKGVNMRVCFQPRVMM